MDECVERDMKITSRLWHCLREGSLLRKPIGRNWEMYEDADTSNYFYCMMPQNVMMGDSRRWTTGVNLPKRRR